MSKRAGVLTILFLVLAVSVVFTLADRMVAPRVAESEVLKREAREADNRFAALENGVYKTEVDDGPGGQVPGAAVEDAEPLNRQASTTVSKMPAVENLLPDPGETELLDTDLNQATQSVGEALASGENPERLTSFLSPPPFDNESFIADPERYLNTIEPGRIYQSVQPGPGVKGIRITSSGFQSLLQGEKVNFSVAVGPGDPVTFHSANMGEFDNRLSTITVLADDQGVATTTFSTTKGMIGLVNVLAASPRTSGQAHFFVHVRVPDSATSHAGQAAEK